MRRFLLIISTSSAASMLSLAAAGDLVDGQGIGLAIFMGGFTAWAGWAATA